MVNSDELKLGSLSHELVPEEWQSDGHYMKKSRKKCKK